MAENLNPVPGIVETAPSSNDYKRLFGHEMIMKDLGLGIDAAEKQGIDPSMANTAVEHFRQAAQNPNCQVSLHLSTAFSHSLLIDSPTGQGLHFSLPSDSWQSLTIEFRVRLA